MNYDKYKDEITILEAITHSLDPKDTDKSLHNKVRIYTYKRNSKALASHYGWKGYYRTFINPPSRYYIKPKARRNN